MSTTGADDATQSSFGMAFPGGSAEFFSMLWNDPETSKSALREFGPLLGIVPEGVARSTAPPDESASDTEIIDGLMNGELDVARVSAEDIERYVRSMGGGDSWVASGWWEQLVKQHGEAALDLAARVHEVERHRTANHIREAIISLDDLDDETDIPFLVEGLLPSGEVHAVVGRNQSGKSFLVAVDLACSVASGTDWLGRHVEQGRVLVVVAEGSAVEYRVRLGAWQAAHPEADLEGLSVSVKKIDLVAKPESYETWTEEEGTVTHQRPATGPSADVRKIVELIREDGYSLVIIDNLQACMDGSSNMSEGDVGSVLSAMHQMSTATARGATVVMISHTDFKDTKPKGLSTFEDRMNTVLHVKALPGAEQREVRSYKNRDGRRWKPIKWHLVASGKSVYASPLTSAGDVDAVHEALSSLAEPSSKNLILSKMKDMGRGVDRVAGLKLIDEMADDEDDPLERVGNKFTLVE